MKQNVVDLRAGENPFQKVGNQLIQALLLILEETPHNIMLKIDLLLVGTVHRLGIV